MPTLRHRWTSLLSRASRLDPVAPEGPTSARCSPGGSSPGGPQALSEGDAAGALDGSRRGCHQPCGASPTKPLPRRPNKVSQRRAKPGSSKLSRRSLSEKPMHTRMSPSSPQHHHALIEDCSPLHSPACGLAEQPCGHRSRHSVREPRGLIRAAGCSPATGVHPGVGREAFDALCHSEASGTLRAPCVDYKEHATQAPQSGGPRRMHTHRPRGSLSGAGAVPGESVRKRHPFSARPIGLAGPV
jgi:hypothetical protein